MALTWHSHHGEQVLVPLQFFTRTCHQFLSPELCSVQTLGLLLLPSTRVRLHQPLGVCCGHIPAPGTAGFNPAQESSPTELPTSLKPRNPACGAPGSVCSGSLRVLWKHRAEPQLCLAARPKDTGMALEKHPVIVATYLWHGEELRDERAAPRGASPAGAAVSPQGQTQGRTGLEQLYQSLSRVFFG